MELARYCGVSHPAVTSWFNGKTKELTANNALKAALFLGVNTQWLTTGLGEMEGSVKALHAEDSVPEGFISIPEYHVECGAGISCPPTFEEATEAKPALYRSEWFRDHGVKPENCKRLKVHGDSMVPILFDGDSILCDCSPGQTIVSGKIYAFCFGDSVRVKRLFTKLNGGLVVHSENEAEHDEEITPDEMTQFMLIGRVIDRSGSGPF